MMMAGGIYLHGNVWVQFDAPRAIKGICVGRFRSYARVDRKVIDGQPEAQVDWSGPETKMKKWTPWTSEEWDLVVERALEVGPYQACKAHNRKTGRSSEGCTDNWKQWKRGLSSDD